MQIADAATFRPSLVLAGKHRIDNAIDAPIYRYDRLGATGGYATATRAIHELSRVTDGAEEGAAVVVHRDGRFYGFSLFQGPTWIAGAGYDFIGLPRQYQRMHFDAPIEVNFKDPAVVAFVDGSVVVRRARG